jgi:fumarylacetoacetate (FAA) hydrolase family protein
VQAIKACGVTFAVSLLERVIEEQAGGNLAKADELRASLLKDIGADLSAIPGSPEAEKLKQQFIARGAWSQYMEVGIGPYAEVFSKSQPMSAVGLGADVGLHPESKWNNPEPEVVLAVNSRAQVSAPRWATTSTCATSKAAARLLLGKAKDNNASCAIGPFIRLFDERFTIDTVRNAERLVIEGAEDGFRLDGESHAPDQPRSAGPGVADLGRAPPVPGRLHALPRHHVLADQRPWRAGRRLHPQAGRRVSISSASLGMLVNHVYRSDAVTRGPSACAHCIATWPSAACSIN